MRRPSPAARLAWGVQETRSWCEHDAPGPCLETGVQRCRGGYERIAAWIPGLDHERVFMTAHVAAWVVQQTGATTMDELWLYYCEVRASGLQLDHLCSNPGCRNPDHVNLCTQSENIQAGRERDYQRGLSHPVMNYTPEPHEVEF